jgi:hypothetical protein
MKKLVERSHDSVAFLRESSDTNKLPVGCEQRHGDLADLQPFWLTMLIATSGLTRLCALNPPWNDAVIPQVLMKSKNTILTSPAAINLFSFYRTFNSVLAQKTDHQHTMEH